MTLVEMHEFIKTHSPEEVRAEASKIKCNICGRPFNEWDIYMGDNRYDIFVNYPSCHDHSRIQFNFCVKCFDRVLDTIIPMCTIDPVVDDNWVRHCVSAPEINPKAGPGGPTSLY